MAHGTVSQDGPCLVRGAQWLAARETGSVNYRAQGRSMKRLS
jgi:hypothetical protein